MRLKSPQDQTLIGESPAFLEIIDQCSRAAKHDRPVLVIGERGTGKELIAARLHFLSPRWERGFIQVNCAALPENLLESELFGHEAGSFTGATARRIGRFEEADKGTLFLDEIATTSLSAQEKLLRVTEYGTFQRIGSNRTLQTDVRIIGATNIDLPSAADRGEFRHDLLDRLALDVITLPPLRHRRDDILLLAFQFAQRVAQEREWSSFPGFGDDMIEALMQHDWPGNIRELKNVVERAVYHAEDEFSLVDTMEIDPFDSPFRPLPKVIKKQDEPSPSASSSPRKKTSLFDGKPMDETRQAMKEAEEMLNIYKRNALKA
ncbi:MAG: sigma 54-interacting transcriptional regulator, partial [Emcibacter sp.]|nr:sigma 54-interacting transcriptional regulator [Emcibacter sp.]